MHRVTLLTLMFIGTAEVLHEAADRLASPAAFTKQVATLVVVHTLKFCTEPDTVSLDILYKIFALNWPWFVVT